MGCTRRLRHEQRRNEGDAFGFPGKTAPRNGQGAYVVALIKHLRTKPPCEDIHVAGGDHERLQHPCTQLHVRARFAGRRDWHMLHCPAGHRSVSRPC